MAATFLGVTVVASIVIVALLRPNGPAAEPPEPISGDVLAITLAPFENLTGDPQRDELGTRVARAIASTLDGSPWPTPRILSTEKSDSTPTALDSRSGEGWVVGSFAGSGDSLFFQIQVSGPVGVRHVSVQIDANGPTDGAIASQLANRVAGALASVLDPRVESWAPGAHPPPDLSAYTDFVVGVESYYDSFRHRRMLGLADEALSRSSDPELGWTAPMVWRLLIARLRTEIIRSEPPSASRRTGLAMADSLLLTLGIRHDEMHSWERGMFDYYQAWRAGDALSAHVALRRALEAHRGSFWEMELAKSAISVGRPSEAIESLAQLDRAAAAMGVWRMYWEALTDAHHMRGDYDAELRAADAGDELSRGIGSRARIRALVALDRPDTAFADALGTFFDNQSGPTATYWNGVLLIRLALEFRAHGYPDRADRILDLIDEWYARAPAEQAAQVGHRRGQALLLEARRRWPEALEAYRTLGREYPNEVIFVGPQGVAAAMLGDSDGARVILDRLQDFQEPEDRAESLLWQGAVGGALGHLKGAAPRIAAAIGIGGLMRPGAHQGGFLHTRPGLEVFWHNSVPLRQSLIPRVTGLPEEPPCPTCPL